LTLTLGEFPPTGLLARNDFRFARESEFAPATFHSGLDFPKFRREQHVVIRRKRPKLPFGESPFDRPMRLCI